MLSILIYEEDYLTRVLLREWLSEAGYRVRSGPARDADSAYPADLVIASVYVPERDGAQWICEIQRAHPGTPLIAISGQFRYGLPVAGTTAQSLGVRQVITKPLTRSELLEAVRGIIGKPA